MASLDDYHLGKVISKGSFGADIRHGRYKSNPDLHVSIKCVSKRALVQQHHPPRDARLYGLAVVQEQKLLQRFSGEKNPYVPRLYACFHNPEFVVTVTQCCMGGSLEDMIRNTSFVADDNTKNNDDDNNKNRKRQKKSLGPTNHHHHPPNTWPEHCAMQLVDILVFLHTSSIVHCDLRPSVLHLTENGNLRLVDFGYALDLKQTNRITIRHPTEYSSPELWNGEPTISTASDLWSAGCIVFAMYMGQSPFAKQPTSTSKKSGDSDDINPSASEGVAAAAAADSVKDDTDETRRRIKEFVKEYIIITDESTKTKQIPNRLHHHHHCRPFDQWTTLDGSKQECREAIYDLLHPDPLHRTQAATMMDTTSGDLYHAIRKRFGNNLQPTTFQPPVPHWRKEVE